MQLSENKKCIWMLSSWINRFHGVFYDYLTFLPIFSILCFFWAKWVGKFTFLKILQKLANTLNKRKFVSKVEWLHFYEVKKILRLKFLSLDKKIHVCLFWPLFDQKVHFFENFQMKSRILASFIMKTAQKGVIRRLSEFPRVRKNFRF